MPPLPTKSLLQRLQEKGTCPLFNTLISTGKILSQPRWHLEQGELWVPHRLSLAGLWPGFSLKNEPRISSSADRRPTGYKLFHLEWCENLHQKNIFFKKKLLEVTKVAKTWWAKNHWHKESSRKWAWYLAWFPSESLEQGLRSCRELPPISKSRKGKSWIPRPMAFHWEFLPSQKLYSQGWARSWPAFTRLKQLQTNTILL